MPAPGRARKRATFLSASAERDRDGNNFIGLYGEYGLTARETLGFELGHTNVGETSALFWLQHALDDSEGPNRLSFALGLGIVDREGFFMPQAQAAAAWGRGFEGILDGGWVSVETRVIIAAASDDPEDLSALPDSALAYLTPEVTAKADATLGLRAGDAMMFINQLRLEERQDTGFSSKLATSVVHDLLGPAKVELGVVLPLSGPDAPAMRLGTWLQF